MSEREYLQFNGWIYSGTFADVVIISVSWFIMISLSVILFIMVSSLVYIFYSFDWTCWRWNDSCYIVLIYSTGIVIKIPYLFFGK
jgi:hypothetical protein